MYYYEVFILKDLPIPDILHTFRGEYVTQFFVVYTKQVAEQDNYRIKSQLTALEESADIEYFYWRFITPKERQKQA